MGQSLHRAYANAEHFVILFASIGLMVLLQALTGERLSGLFGAGVLLGLSLIMKQHGIAFVGLAILYILNDSLMKRPFNWRDLTEKTLSFVGGVTLVIGALCLILIWTGVFHNFWFWTFEYASTYVSQVPLTKAWPNFIDKFLPIVHSAPLIWILCGLGVCLLIVKGLHQRSRVFMMLFAGFSVLSICPGFFFRPHYFLLILPCASLFVGITISLFRGYFARFSSQQYLTLLAAAGLLVFSLSHSVFHQREYLFHLTPFQSSRSTFWMNPFPESIEVADYIQKHTAPDDRIAILGSEPQILFYSKRRSVSPYMYMYPLMEDHEFALQMQKKFIKDIEESNPRYIVYVGVSTSWLAREYSHMDLVQWFDEYQNRGDMKLVGVVESFKNKAAYHWDLENFQPVSSQFWIAIFERTN